MKLLFPEDLMLYNYNKNQAMKQLMLKEKELDYKALKCSSLSGLSMFASSITLFNLGYPMTPCFLPAAGICFYFFKTTKKLRSEVNDLDTYMEALNTLEELEKFEEK